MTALDQREFVRVRELMERPEQTIFVFGSNRAGVHGGGAARVAHQEYGATWAQGEGLAGRSYGIPTKDDHIDSLPLADVAAHVSAFLAFAASRPDLTFAVTRIGCGLAGFSDADIAPLFLGAPENCELPEGWNR